MAHDDMVSDEALAKRVDILVNAAGSLYDIVTTRAHLVDAARLMASSNLALEKARASIREKAQDDPDQLKFRSRVRRECFPAWSGVWFYPFDPRADEVRHEDIVMSLSRLCRFNGHVSRTISVAEHSIKVAAMAEHLISLEVAAGNLSEQHAYQAALHGLMHDAHEAYLGDIIGPIKKCIIHAMGETWETVEGRVQAAILEAYGIAPPPPEVEEAVCMADKFALYCESLVLKANCDIPGHDKLPTPPPDVMAVGMIRREEPDGDKVRDLFDSEVRRLVATFKGHVPTVVRPAAVVDAAAVDLMRARSEPRTPTGTGSWRSAVKSAAVDIPPDLMDAPEFKDSR